MKNSVLVAINDSISSKAVLDYLCKVAFCPDSILFNLIHIYRKQATGDELMGKKFMKSQPTKMKQVLKKAKNKLVENGYSPDSISINFVNANSQSISEEIIKQFKKKKYDTVVIGRKRMSKAEEFVLGDPGIKLVRALESTAVIVVKCQ